MNHAPTAFLYWFVQQPTEPNPDILDGLLGKPFGLGKIVDVQFIGSGTYRITLDHHSQNFFMDTQEAKELITKHQTRGQIHKLLDDWKPI